MDRSAINVRIFNYANVPPDAFGRARTDAQRVLDHAGVSTRWTECGVVPSSGGNPRCTAKLRPNDIVVRVISQAVDTYNRHSEFGVALLPSGGGFGVHATIFYGRVESYADRWQASIAPLLGHLIAHEIGHLLLGVNSHSNSGIMNATWRRDDLERIAHAALLFSRQEGRKMREQVLQRVALATAAP